MFSFRFFGGVFHLKIASCVNCHPICR